MRQVTLVSWVAAFLVCLPAASAGESTVAPAEAQSPFNNVGPANVLLVANGNFPGSVALARYYAIRRAIPEGHLLVIDAATTEDVDRESFNLEICGPIRARLAEMEAEIRCFVVFHGVPLNIWDPLPVNNDISKLKHELEGIRQQPQSGDAEAIQQRITELESEVKKTSVKAASVDSELALLGREHELENWTASPLVSRKEWPEGCYWVARLDGSNPQDVRAMIDGALEAEKGGLTGIAYFDGRGLTGDDAYGRMDAAIGRAARLARQNGLAAVADNRPELFAPAACPEAAVYWGWYSLGKYVDSFRFRPGAIAVHVASGECNSLREGTYWCRNLIANGAAVTMGPTNEPLLQAFVAPDDFLKVLFEGGSVGEAYYATQKWLSWRMVLLGDPLYRPFRAGRASAQVSREPGDE